MSMIFLVKGHAHLGISKRDKDGNVTESIPAHFEFAPDGPCVAVGELDPETMEIKGEADIYGDWDAAGYLKSVLEKLQPVRKSNVPDFKAIVNALWEKDRTDICDYCKGYNCRDCIVNEWKEEAE